MGEEARGERSDVPVTWHTELGGLQGCPWGRGEVQPSLLMEIHNLKKSQIEELVGTVRGRAGRLLHPLGGAVFPLPIRLCTRGQAALQYNPIKENNSSSSYRSV